LRDNSSPNLASFLITSAGFRTNEAHVLVKLWSPLLGPWRR